MLLRPTRSARGTAAPRGCAGRTGAPSRGAPSIESAAATSAARASRSAPASGQRRDRGRRLRAVDEREPFLGPERDRRSPAAASASRPPTSVGRVADRGLALADEDERQVGERREIAARADRAAARHARVDAVVEQVEQPLERLAPDAGEALGEHVRAQRHRGAHGADRQRVADAGGVAAQQVHLQRAERVARDGRSRRARRTRVDAVDRRVAERLTIDDGARRVDARRGVRREPDG